MNFQALLGASERYLRKNGPTILTGSGVIGFGATTILVGKAVLRSQTTMSSFHERKKKLEKKVISETYTKQEHTQDVGKLYVGTAKELTRIFWPAVTVGVVSVAAVVSAHGMMKQREASLVAAYATLNAGFKAYRKRVEEELGADKEDEFYRGIRSTKEDKSDTGQPCIINNYDKNRPSAYSRFFDKASTGSWTKTPEYNLMFLRQQEQWANDQLTSRGHVFLNEVYDALGLERSQAGQIVGWLAEGDGDGYVDFGLYNGKSPEKIAFINGQNDSVMVDFNVDGPITI